MNQLRIIGGRWRGRRFSFPEVIGLRPSGDRIRETLFNWLQLSIVDAHCLDLFAGSGMLGFEALSRGAAQVTMVDQHPEVISHLQRVADQLKVDEIKIIRSEIPASTLLNQLAGAQFTHVFLDPPFHQGLVQTTCAWLASSGLLKSGALIYIEAERSLDPLPLPAGWKILRSKTTGQVGYHLIQG
jgi:16S rRNA (guanine966-N2)-methyltransferase